MSHLLVNQSHNFGTFYAWKLKFGLLLSTYPDLNLQVCARIAPGSCPGVGLGSMFMFILTYMIVSNIHNQP